MDERVSDFDDILTLFMKVEMESCSKLGSKHQQKLFGGRSLYVSLNKYKHCWGKTFCMTQHAVVLLIMDMVSGKSGVNGQKKKYIFCYSVLKSDKTFKKWFNNVET